MARAITVLVGELIVMRISVASQRSIALTA